MMLEIKDNKTNNHLSRQHMEHKKYHDIWC